MTPINPHCPFSIQRGVNISHWLSQRPDDQPKPDDYFDYNELVKLREFGFDHIRLPVDESILWDENGEQKADNWRRLHAALDWCDSCKMRVIVDLHIIRSHYFNAGFSGKENALWVDEQAQEQLVYLWEKLSQELITRPNELVAYEVMNEPVAPEHDLWNAVFARVYKALRAREPNRVIIFGANMWQSTRNIPQLVFPENDPNIVLSFHFYEPMLVTHYQAKWTPLHQYTGPVSYPGIPYDPSFLPERSDEPFQTFIQDNNHWDRDRLEAILRPALEFALKQGKSLYCGEWGCRTVVPKAVRLAWHADMAALFTQYQIPWTIWDFKGGFAVVDVDTRQGDRKLIEILTRN